MNEPTPIQAVPALVPTPKAIDKLANEYAEAQAIVTKHETELKAEKATADEIKGRLIAMVQAFGGKHAEKSLRLAGLHSTNTVTIGTQVSVDPVAVEEFRGYLNKQEIPDLSSRFFTEHVTYSLVNGPTDVLAKLDLPARIRTKMSALLGLCFKITTKNPSLKVEIEPSAKPLKIQRAG
jgi:hypothetical protein